MTVSIESWEKLAKALQKEATIMGYRNTAKNLSDLYLEDLAVIKQNRIGDIITFGGLWSTTEEKCLEAGSFWVHPEYRNKKHSSWMFQRLSEKIPTGYLAMCITHVDKVAHLVIKSGWSESSKENWHSAVPFAASCGPCDVVADNEKMTCPHMATKSLCRMFYKIG
ncbi:MAG: hypothetical protein WC848_01260 [Parcubacteria group bacterium]|jgi:hypothetical protein